MIKLLKNKKAQEGAEEERSAEKSIYYLIFGFILLFIIFILMYIFYSEGMKYSQIPKGLETFILKQRFFSNCFNYEDELTKRSYNLIDYNKFNQEMMNNCYNTENTREIAFSLQLIGIDNGKDVQIKTKNWNENGKIKSPVNVSVIKDNIVYETPLVIAIKNER